MMTMRCSVFAVLCSVLSYQTFAADKSHPVTVTVDADGLKAVRVSIVGKGKSSFAPAGVRQRKTSKGVPYFYAPVQFKLQLPAGQFQLFVAAGTEFVPSSRKISIKGRSSLQVRLGRWSNLAKQGWYAGDSHVHLHTGGPIQVTTRDALLAAQAEGIHYVNLCVSNNVGDDIRDEDLITGKPHEHSTKNHLLVFGEEMRSMIYGHMQFFGIRKFVEPQYTGFKNTPNSFDYPANFVMAANATAQGGVVTYGHPMFKGQPLPFGKDPTANNAAARELPIDAILGVVQAIDIMGYNSDEDLSTELWYKLLNCGLRLSACVGTDALLDQSTDPMGGSRVYVQVNGKLTQKKWLTGLKQGRTFVTNGPTLSLKVEGQGPGSTVKIGQAGQVRIHGSTTSYAPIDRVEIIVNGKVTRRLPVSKPTKKGSLHQLKFDGKVRLDKSSWLALRVRGGEHAHLFDGPAFAHTSPVFVRVGNLPIRSRKDATYFVEWINQLIRVVTLRNGYKSEADRKKVVALFRRAQAKFQKMAEKSK